MHIRLVIYPKICLRNIVLQFQIEVTALLKTIWMKIVLVPVSANPRNVRDDGLVLYLECFLLSTRVSEPWLLLGLTPHHVVLLQPLMITQPHLSSARRQTTPHHGNIRRSVRLPGSTSSHRLTNPRREPLNLPLHPK